MTGRCFRFLDEVRDVSSRGQLEAGEYLRERGVEDRRGWSAGVWSGQLLVNPVYFFVE